MCLAPQASLRRLVEEASEQREQRRRSKRIHEVHATVLAFLAEADLDKVTMRELKEHLKALDMHSPADYEKVSHQSPKSLNCITPLLIESE